MEISSGSVVGGYRIVRLLGRGAMGSVYEAQHRTLPRTVALKVMNPEIAQYPELRTRFEREADLLCALEHPNIVDALDRGQDGDRLFIAMRYVDGTDLDTALRERGAFLPEQAVDVVATIGRALDHAHSRGLLHRDVKPANIMLRRGEDGAEDAVLGDFGIAKDLAADVGLTAQGGVLGTIPYTAPEQLEGKAVDRRADVYSLGAVLFELLTARRAFPLEQPEALLTSVVLGPVPDLLSVRPDLTPALAAVVTRALQKEPGDRFATCSDLAAAARTALAPAPSAPPTTVGHVSAPPPPQWSPGAGGRVQTLRDPHPAPARTPQGPDRRSLRWLLVALALAVLGGIAALVVAATAGEGDGGGTATDEGTQGSLPASAPPTADGDTTGATTPAALAVGSCLDAGSEPTACDGAHDAEVYSTTGCTQEALLDFLGGQPGTDVLRSDLALANIGPACTVGLPGAELDESVAGVLDGPADEWRRCDDGGEARPCSEPHTGEYVFEQQAPTDPLNCTARAGDYMGAPFSRHVDALAVREAGTTCLVEVRGSNVLTASLRDLDSGALPLEAD